MLQKTIKKLFAYLLKNIPQKNKFLRFLFKSFNKDPLLFAYNNMGVLNYQNEIISGEKFLITNILPKYFSKDKNNIFFDVGSNIGDYSKNLTNFFSVTTIYSFEPNRNSFRKLKVNVADSKNIKCFQIGFSDKKRTSELYTYSNDLDSQHASIYKNVFSDLHSSNNIISIPIDLICLDDFCRDHNLDSIDFLKIDTEGTEIEVLKGAREMIKEGRIKIIQFEFNEMNIISRVFLKDFYQILADYRIYRLSEKHLIPLFHYDSTNEIFKFQNMLAIHKTL